MTHILRRLSDDVALCGDVLATPRRPYPSSGTPVICLSFYSRRMGRLEWGALAICVRSGSFTCWQMFKRHGWGEVCPECGERVNDALALIELEMAGQPDYAF